MPRQLPTAQQLVDSGLRLPPDAVVAIDGPAGSGKSTTARAIARSNDGSLGLDAEPTSSDRVPDES